MSKFSGKCDLYDHMMMEKTYDMGSYLISDEMECFEIFKQKTGGVIHQHKEIKVSEYNGDYIASHCPEFKVIKHQNEVPDGRCKSGVKTITYSTYIYWGKEYTLKEINRKGVWITIDIPFNTILDLIPYYPYIISVASCSEGRSYIVVSGDPYPARQFEESLKSGWEPHFSFNYYNAILQEHYLEICKDYLLKDLEKRTKTIRLTGAMPGKDGDYELAVPAEIDYNHRLEYVWDDGKRHLCYSSPKLIGPSAISVSKEDIESMLKDDIAAGRVGIKYVEKTKGE